MIECVFACQTDRGTKCNYTNSLCYSKSGWDCPTMELAVEEFEGLLNNSREDCWSEEFMEGVVRKYGGTDGD